MKEIKIDVEMGFKLDKNIYTASNFEWPVSSQNKTTQPNKNYATFFDYHVIQPIADDYEIIKREADRTIENQKQYAGVIKFLENVIPEIQKSIKYTVLSEENNIEKIQANFHFTYYQCDIPNERTPEYLFNLLVMTAGINRYKGNIKITNRAVSEAQARKEIFNLDIIENKLQQWNYIVRFYEEMTFELDFKEQPKVTKLKK